uniref:Uncharacterized protein LOC111109240 n=1 Tax=Crassostrea virginica TaxID=6565 RepID=A0A8B8BDF6_CRAVI|nr:uncharacterized protein LOC111109240 [Crassostrea virginica]
MLCVHTCMYRRSMQIECLIRCDNNVRNNEFKYTNDIQDEIQITKTVHQGSLTTKLLFILRNLHGFQHILKQHHISQLFFFDTFLDEESLYEDVYQLEEENQCGFRQLHSNSSRTPKPVYPLGLHFPQQSHRRMRGSCLDVTTIDSESSFLKTTKDSESSDQEDYDWW